MKKGHGFCRHGLLKQKSHGQLTFDPPMAVLVFVTLPSPPQRQADRRIIVIKPETKNIVICVDMSVHLKNLSF
jgi:hypothetical protein